MENSASTDQINAVLKELLPPKWCIAIEEEWTSILDRIKENGYSTIKCNS